MSKKITAAVEAEKGAVIEMLVSMREGIDVASRTAGPTDIGTLRFASGFVSGIIETIEDNLHRGQAPQPKPLIILS
jgi:hypothetical protein